jgi:signal transduction histidine kinase
MIRPFRTLRGRLLAMVAALLAVTLGGAAVISNRVAHVELRKFEVEERTAHRPPPAVDALRDFYRMHGSWTGIEPVLEKIGRAGGADVFLFDSRRQLVAGYPARLRSGRAELSPEGALTYAGAGPGGQLIRERILGPQLVIRGEDGAPAGSLFILPPHDKSSGLQTRSLDRWFFWTFLGATLFGVVLAAAIARWITVPVEKLTAATRRLEAGDLSVTVEPSGGAELEELARGFNAMAAALERNEELRRRMVGDVAHELRAPLTNIRCDLESIQDGLMAPSPEQIESLHREAMHLAGLVDDLQDLALADAGRLEIDARPVSIAALAQHAAAGIETRARDHGVTVVREGAEDLVVLADPRRAVQILTNLLTNAVTHMHQAGDVRIAWERDGMEAVIRVRDSGTGIGAEELTKIFERFYRVDVSRARATGGAGLGLPIVRQLVTAHGGRVWAESTPGAGSTFSFTLPIVTESIASPS